jgi:hypothetical protein
MLSQRDGKGLHDVEEAFQVSLGRTGLFLCTVLLASLESTLKSVLEKAKAPMSTKFNISAVCVNSFCFNFTRTRAQASTPCTPWLHRPS